MKNTHNQLNEFPKEQVRSAIQEGILQAEEQINKMNSAHSHKNENVKRKKLYAVSSAVAILGILVSTSYFSPALASSLSQIPIIGSVFGDSNLIGLQQAQKKGLTSKIGETQTINGISVTLDEILYDQNDITIGLKIESEKELGELYFGAGMDYTINGELPTGSSGGGFREDIQSSTIRTAIQDISVTEDLPNAFELGLILHGENGETWYFSTPIKQIKDIIKVPIQHLESVDGIDLNVTELSLSETGVSISYKSSEEGKDFELSRAGDIEFLMVDQDGNEIKGPSGGVTGERLKNSIVFTSKKRFDPIDTGVNELTITPYLALPTDGGGVEFDKNGESRELEFKGDSLQPVEFESFKVKIPQ
ncbi:DUF4179 domain-containing protein [Peribacillus frigoritolerans]|uniref:DUF4179 domain-containing protein n=1 Tax=Peribacillus frigoritolerans TaxID=450367 RepID=UPI0039A20F0E